MGETRPPGKKAAAVLGRAGVLIRGFVRAEFSTRPLERGGFWMGVYKTFPVNTSGKEKTG